MPKKPVTRKRRVTLKAHIAATGHAFSTHAALIEELRQHISVIDSVRRSVESSNNQWAELANANGLFALEQTQTHDEIDRRLSAIEAYRKRDDQRLSELRAEVNHLKKALVSHLNKTVEAPRRIFPTISHWLFGGK